MGLASCAAPVTPAAPAPVATSAPGPSATQSATAAAFTDPFAYCGAVVNADTPGAPYSGPKVPDAVIQGIKKAAGMSADIPSAVVMNGTFWRCMDGKVYACFVGANLPCDGKGNANQTPNAAETDFCKSSPTAENIPAAVTGHDTIYAWRCSQGQPQIAQQVFHLDARGYISEIWYALSPG